MFGDKDRENGNFNSIPNVSFDMNGQPNNNNNNNVNMVPSGFQGFNPEPVQSGPFASSTSAQLEEINNTVEEVGNTVNNSMPINSGGFNMYACGDCNTVFGSNGGTVNNCIFCHGSNVTPSQPVDTSFEGIIPFLVPKNKAVEDYKSKIMMNPVIPFIFKSKKIINSISKFYIPGYLYNTLTRGDVNLLGVDSTPNGKKKFDVTFNTSVEHNNVFYKATSKISEKVFNAMGNYNFNNIVPFDSNNLGNCYYLSNDLNKIDIINKMEDNCKKHVMAIARKKVNHQMKKVQGNNLLTQINRNTSILVPVYLLNVRYGNKDYMYIMNGENGKSSLDVTYGILEMIIFGLIIAAIVFGISVFASMMF